MRELLSRLASTVREVAFGVDAGHAIRHGVTVSGSGAGRRDEGVDPGGGPFLHWVPDRDGGFRLAGDYVPDEWSRPLGAGPERPRRGRGFGRPGRV